MRPQQIDGLREPGALADASKFRIVIDRKAPGHKLRLTDMDEYVGDGAREVDDKRREVAARAAAAVGFADKARFVHPGEGMISVPSASTEIDRMIGLWLENERLMRSAQQ